MPGPFSTFMDRRRSTEGGLNTNVGESLRPMLEEWAAGGPISPGDIGQGLAQARHAGNPGDGHNQAQVALDAALEATLVDAARIGAEEDRRFSEQSAFLGQEFAQANVPTITDATIQRLFGQGIDRAQDDASQAMANVREHLGASGIGGGAAAGLFSSVELERLGQITGAKRGTQIFKAEMDRQDRLDRYDRALGLASFRNQSPSTFFSDALASLTDLRFSQLGIEAQDKAARRAAKAQTMAGIGSIAGAGLSALGGL